MLKIEISEIIQDFFGMNSDEMKQYDPRILDKWIETGFNKIIYGICLTAIKHSDYAQLDPFIKPFEKVPILCNEDRNEYYSILPASVIALPENRGIYRIGLMKDRKTSFIFRENGTSDIYENLEFSLINKIPTFYQEMNKVYFDERITPEMIEQGLLMKLIVPFSELDDDDVIPLPGGKDNDILQLVLQELSLKPIEDNKNNSTATPKK